MAAVLSEIRPDDAQLEALWRRLHAAWVAASEELAEADEKGLSETNAVDAQILRYLRAHEAHQRDLLERFERQMRDFRSRTSAYRARY